MLPFIPLLFVCTHFWQYTVLGFYQHLQHKHHMAFVLYPLAAFSINHNLGFIRVHHQPFTLYAILPSIKLSSQVIFTALSQRIWISQLPWCVPAFTSELSLLSWTVLRIVLAPMYIHISVNTVHLSTCSLHMPIWSLSILSNAFSRPQIWNDVSCLSLWISPASVLRPILDQCFIYPLWNQTACHLSLFVVCVKNLLS